MICCMLRWKITCGTKDSSGPLHVSSLRSEPCCWWEVESEEESRILTPEAAVSVVFDAAVAEKQMVRFVAMRLEKGFVFYLYF